MTEEENEICLLAALKRHDIIRQNASLRRNASQKQLRRISSEHAGQSKCQKQSRG